ncbi:proton-conducting transporter membrane subunit [Escherichia coli]
MARWICACWIAAYATAAAGSDIRLLGVIGFGLLAGIIPLHGWVPQHANASAPAAALFCTVVMKIGLLGILTLSLLGGNAPLWWGIALLVLGMITAFVGGLCTVLMEAQHPAPAGLPHPGKYRHYPAGAGRRRNGYRVVQSR